MASKCSPASEQAAPSRRRLQSVNQDFSDLSEQIRQVAHIIRLPEDWASIKAGSWPPAALQHVVRARAEWVLRWLLDKLRNESPAGAEARAMPATWQLLECIMEILPVSRSAPHLRDAGFTSILEKVLVENFDKDEDANGPSVWHHGRILSRDASDSSETVCDDAQPSRKRKRGSPGVSSSPSKRTALASSDPLLLFGAVHALLRNMTGTTTSHTKAHSTTQTELKKMVVRGDSAQAARILKFWLLAVQKLLVTALAQDPDRSTLAVLVDLSVVFEIWELRNVGANGSTGSSEEDFANECLVPTLQLAGRLKSIRAATTEPRTSKALDLSLQSLDKLISRHLLAPARSAFVTETYTASNDDSSHRAASALSSSLGSLRAALLQIAQIEDDGDAVPPHLASLSNSIAYLLDLAIRTSPARTPKARLAERPWIQAVFLSLSECAGCSLDAPPVFATPKSAVVALQSALSVLHSHHVTINSRILRDLFWYHCGVKYPQQGTRQVHWALIAALIELDSSIFTTESRALPSGSREPETDLTEVLFDQISNTDFRDSNSMSESDVVYHEADDLNTTQKERLELILERIVTPIVSAFSRNRNMLGFMRKWDDQLVKSYKFENPPALKEKTELVWEHHILTKSLSEVFERSLTQGQIATLLEEHVSRLDDFSNALAVQANEDVRVRKLTAFEKAASSAVLIPAILESTRSEDILTALRPQLHSLFVLYAQWVQSAHFSVYTRLSLSWFTLCLLLYKLWPLEFHGSTQLQQELLHALVEQASKDISASQQELGGRKVDSGARAAATTFALIACDQLQTVSGSEELVQRTLHKITMKFSAPQLEVSELMSFEQFCAHLIQLMSHLELQVAQESILAMLTSISTFDSETQHHMSRSLSQAIFRHRGSALHTAYASAVLDALAEDADARLHCVALQNLLCVQASALTRERREAILDRLSALLTAGSVATLDMLSAMANLMVVPNASAKISTDGGVIFDIAVQLQKQGTTSPVILKQLRLLSERILRHIIPNQTQPQSRTLLGEYQKRLNTLAKGTKKLTSTGLAIMRATILEQKDAQLLSTKQYVALLKQCITDDGTDGNDAASFEDVLDAFDEVSTALMGDPTSLKATANWLRTWIKDNADLDSYIVSPQTGSVEVAEYVAKLHKLVARYRLYPDTRWLVALSLKLLRGPLAHEQQKKVLATVEEALIPLETAEKMSLVPFLVEVDEPSVQIASFTILVLLVSTLSEKLSTDAGLKQSQIALLPRLCRLLIDTTNVACFDALMDCIDTFLNHKASLTTQHSVECVLGALVKFTSRTSPILPSDHASHIFTRLCETSRLVLLVHRSKTGGRSHIFIPLLQGLLFCLFTPTSARSGALPMWLRSGTSESICLTPTDAAHYTRLLGMLCNPPQSSISKAHQHASKSKHLTDPVKAARERTSHFLYPLLASLCRFQLTGRLLPTVRAKLMPGIYEVMSTASLHKDELTAMFAGLSRSEKDVWRSFWAEWESVSKSSGRNLPRF